MTKENLGGEIVDLIMEQWSIDEGLMLDALMYLYENLKDENVKEQITQIIKDFA